ncbi:threonine-phosphate decarboxylase CobD [Noviherbaspirillum saxi]|uniref:threonine-phosphate decarboxylase n=1 Tax=Noviherbaspirillum saxi TaxID=2320863 RepID=A0A3A3FRH7_9BURK|nr:threonine-phosphate decarboxylase CobD [Noviherbaspirillum saxi]RJF98100.1 threonine-phosphate decarboxylase [Noviherbaspirillum saxi]
MLEHGGNLREAALRFGRPESEWLDLSTGINPVGYPVPTIAADAWHRLPQASDTLLAAARTYYGAPHLLPVAGTQAAIQALPRIRKQSKVVLSAPSYAEHAHCWRQAGHTVQEIAYDHLAAHIDQADVMVICNPNNPTGATIAPGMLLDWAGRLAARDGWLVVDEAFGDTVPKNSVACHTHRQGLIVLRSIGKFFGLAGLRLGFVAADHALLHRLADWIGPWTVSGPAQDIGCAALSDRQWQQEVQSKLIRSGDRLHRLLAEYGIDANGTALFQWWPEEQPEVFAHHMAERGIWVRLFARQARGIRLGLPGDEAGWLRLMQALEAWKRNTQ